MLIDLDELDELARRLWLFSVDRFNIVSFHNVDHGDGSVTPLRHQIVRRVQDVGVDLDGGRICLLCMPRILGYAFNPLSIFFCYARDGRLVAIDYEVHNTFGRRHSYVFRIAREAGAVLKHRCEKQFDVSPFMPMAMVYKFRVCPPQEKISIAIEGVGAEGPLIVAALGGARCDLSSAALAVELVRHPFLTLKVIAAIHWQALRMILKGFRFQA